MAVDLFGNSIIVFHAFNNFLSTNSGELAKKVIELIIFSISTYMLISEYRRSKRTELKYLMVGFCSLTISRFIMTGFYLFIVFGKVTFVFLELFLPIIIEFLDIFALILVGSAFLYPSFRKDVRKAISITNYQIFALLILSLIIQLGWLILFRMNNNLVFTQSFGFFIFELVKLLVLIYPCYIIFFNKQIYKKYRFAIITAFFLYSINVIVNLVNIVIYNYKNSDLKVFAQPFPFLATLFFVRVIYLKLVDKAYLKEKLEETEMKYFQEKELGRMKDEFVSTVSHELRTPITSVKLYLSLIKDGKMGKVNKKQKEAISIVDDEISRLNYLINDILNLSKLEQGKISLELSNVNIYELTKNNLYEEMAKQKNIQVLNRIPENFMAVVDKEKFRQVIVNLFSNALKFTERGSITIDAKKSKNEFIFSIKDTGIGIEKKNLYRIFEKFYQVEEHLTRKEKGTGLGLAIVEKIVNLHKGKIEVNSELGKGAEFIIRIPQ
ncbi:MAG: HAMP domain-containing sensor histidine kinase [Candidatus Woesearchaeota archaeon]